MTEVIQLETIAHWWCRRCGRWEVCDADLCVECSFMAGARVRRRPGPNGGRCSTVRTDNPTTSHPRTSGGRR